jgi:thioredoxin reductase (NADPH)
MSGTLHRHNLQRDPAVAKGIKHEHDPAAPVTRAVIVAVDESPERMERIERALKRRFGEDYDIVAESTPHGALDRLAELSEGPLEVALVLADAWMPDMDVGEFLAAVGELHPTAKRAVLVEWGELIKARESIIRGAAMGQLEGFLAKPWRDADEDFYFAVAEYLAEWDREHRPQFEAIRIVGDPWDAYVQGLRDALFRSGVDHGFYDVATERGHELLGEVGAAASPGELPVVILFDGRVLHHPTAAEIAAALGVNTDPAAQVFDVTVVGAGPGGLAAAVYGSSEGLDVLVVDQEALGGQAGTSSMIRNYLGFPRGLSGAELAIRAYGQAWFFGSNFLIGRSATGLRAEGDLLVVTFDDGSEARSRTVILAAGVAYRRLGTEKLEALVGRGIFYGAPITEARGLGGQHVVVIGGGNSSGQASLYLSRYASRVTLVVRGAALDEMSEYLIRELDARPNIFIRMGTELADAVGERRLQAVRLRQRETGAEEEVACSAAFVLIGASPRTDWLPPEIERDERGYVATGDEVTKMTEIPGSADPGAKAADSGAKPADSDAEAKPVDSGSKPARRPAAFETSMPGVFAVGDVRLGSIKRVAGAVGEGSNAIRIVHEYLARQVVEKAAAPKG